MRWGNFDPDSLLEAPVKTLNPAASPLTVDLGDIDTSLGRDLPLAVDFGLPAASSLFAASFLIGSSRLDLELSALESEGFGEVISKPKVLTGDKQTAYIKSGSEVAYQEAASSGATTTAFKEAVLQLEATPQITPDNKIILDLNIQQDSIGALVYGGEPTIDVTELQTQVLVGNGETLVLGGVFQMISTEAEERVPLLSDIPLLGKAFTKTLKMKEKQEILIFITPKIVTQDADTQ